MAVYPTLYENDEGQVVRGPDIGGHRWTVAMNTFCCLIEIGYLPKHARIIGEYDVDVEKAIETGKLVYKLLGVPWSSENTL